MHRKKDRVARSPFENNSSANTCLVGYVARHDQIARENAFLCSRPFHRLIIERWPPVFLLPPSFSLSLLFLSPSYRYRTTRHADRIDRGRVDSSRMQRPRLIIPITDFWKPRRRVERRAWPAFPLRHSLRSRQFRSRDTVSPMITKSYVLSFSNYNKYTIGW